MKSDLDISIFEIVGRPVCFASDDGQKVYDRLAVAVKEGRRISLSFHNITALTPAFLNAAIGQLYGAFSEEQIRAFLKMQNMQPDDQVLLKRVVETAKLYFKDPQRFDQAMEDVGGDTPEMQVSYQGVGRQ